MVLKVVNFRAARPSWSWRAVSEANSLVSSGMSLITALLSFSICTEVERST